MGSDLAPTMVRCSRSLLSSVLANNIPGSLRRDVIGGASSNNIIGQIDIRTENVTFASAGRGDANCLVDQQILVNSAGQWLAKVSHCRSAVIS
jgi:hypothetical protein